MLDEVVFARAGRLGVGFNLAHGIPLVKAREDHDGLCHLLSLRSLAGDVDVNEARQDVEPGVTLPDLLPEIRRAMTGG